MHVVTVLQTRGQLGCDFAPKHVLALKKQIDRWTPGVKFTCFTDVDVPGVTCIPLNHRWLGWWAKMEIFRPGIRGDFLYIDLDTVVVGSIDEFFRIGHFTGLRDKNPKCFGGGLLFIPERDKAVMWADFTRDPEGNIAKFSQPGQRCDQSFMEQYHGGTAKIWEDILPGRLVDIRQVRHSGVPAGARMVIFHNKPRPWDSVQFGRMYR